MPYSRDSLSSYWLILWVIVFFSGMFFLFSLLLGYAPYSPYSGEQKSPYSIVSPGNIISLGGKALGKDEQSGTQDLGLEEFCFSRFFFKERCITKTISSNKNPFLEMKNVLLFSRNPRQDIVTDKNVVFDPNGKGLAWYDAEKKIVFGIRKDDKNFFSQVFSYEGTSLDFDAEKQQYFLKPLNSFDSDMQRDLEEKKENEKNTENKKVLRENKREGEREEIIGEEGVEESIDINLLERKIGEEILTPIEKEIEPEYISFDSFSLNIPDVENVFAKDLPLMPSLSSFLLRDPQSGARNIVASFFPLAEEIIPFEGSYYIVFDTSLWFYFPEEKSFQKIFQKDPNSPVFFHEKTKSFFFFLEKNLVQSFL